MPYPRPITINRSIAGGNGPTELLSAFPGTIFALSVLIDVATAGQVTVGMRDVASGALLDSAIVGASADGTRIVLQAHIERTDEPVRVRIEYDGAGAWAYRLNVVRHLVVREGAINVGR